MMPPDETENLFVVTLKCEDCRAWRSYRIEAQLRAVFERQVRSLGISVECEECGNTIEVGLGWVPDRGKGNPQREAATGPSFGFVTDPVGLKRG
jgi:hypothetical protein